MRPMPYTHWAYFTNETEARACGTELTSRFDCLVGVAAPGEISDQWLVRAARTVETDELIQRHDEVEAIVTQHGGFYDGGESGWMDPATGRFA